MAKNFIIFPLPGTAVTGLSGTMGSTLSAIHYSTFLITDLIHSDRQAIKHSSILLKGTSAQSWKKMTHFFHASGINNTIIKMHMEQ